MRKAAESTLCSVLSAQVFFMTGTIMGNLSLRDRCHFGACSGIFVSALPVCSGHTTTDYSRRKKDCKNKHSLLWANMKLLFNRGWLVWSCCVVLLIYANSTFLCSIVCCLRGEWLMKTNMMLVGSCRDPLFIQGGHSLAQ